MVMSMFDSDKIITGLVVFLCIMTFPVWFLAVGGKSSFNPKYVTATEGKQCVEPTEYMKERHMQLLSEWKELSVRNGVKTYKASDGKEYDISLTGTCIECHSDKADFCDRCHGYVGVTPYCWECHNVPENKSN
jgi:hypothetical protein